MTARRVRRLLGYALLVAYGVAAFWLILIGTGCLLDLARP